jgi:hypothetical protein
MEWINNHTGIHFKFILAQEQQGHNYSYPVSRRRIILADAAN